MVNPARIVEELNRAGVEYVVIGGVAATLYGCPEQTYDLDILYEDSEDNRRRLLAALTAIRAEWDRPLDEQILTRQPVFALNTAQGDLDIFTRVPGVDNYLTVAARAEQFDLDGVPVRALDLTSLILAKEAAADPNPRKQAALAFLKELNRRRRG